jgi:hypothetical protein
MPDSLNVSFPDSDLDYVLPNPDGYGASVAAEDSVETFAAAGFVDFPDEYWIEPKDWEDYARENDKHKSWADDYSNRFMNQANTHECTCMSLAQIMEIVWNQQRGMVGPDSVYFSPLGTYEEANPRQRGGASIRGVLTLAMRRGMVPEYHGPEGPNTQRDKFQFTRVGTCGKGNATQSRGAWLPYSQYPAGHQNTSRHFMPLKVINIRSWEQHFCLLLRGRAVGNGRSGHAIPHVKAVKRGGEWVSQYKDSYDVYRYDSIRMVKSGVGASFCVASMTMPDDWKRPAGSDMK